MQPGDEVEIHESVNESGKTELARLVQTSGNIAIVKMLTGEFELIEGDTNAVRVKDQRDRYAGKIRQINLKYVKPANPQ